VVSVISIFGCVQNKFRNKPYVTCPVGIWAFCSSSTERTTNARESFHNNFNAIFYVSHPDIYRFIETQKDIQLNIFLFDTVRI
jgi:nitrous oxidase accessory protein NosD